MPNDRSRDRELPEEVDYSPGIRGLHHIPAAADSAEATLDDKFRASPETVLNFLISDFECSWDALAKQPKSIAPARGNFKFALHACILLEFVGQLESKTSNPLKQVVRELRSIEPRYFTKMGYPSGQNQKPPKWLQLSIDEDYLPNTLLAHVFDLIRNGQAHQYHDIPVKLKGGRAWALGLRPAEEGYNLQRVKRERDALSHLSFRRDQDGDLIVLIHPGALFLDLRAAILGAKLFDRGITIKYFGRDAQCSVCDLETALLAGGLTRIERWPSASTTGKPRYNQGMAQQLEAIYENGVFRPLEPVSLKEHQRVTVRISELEPADDDNARSHRYAEQAWLAEHSDEYRGQWVALEGPDLISHGSDAVSVRNEARDRGVQHPLMVHIAEDFDQPSAGLLQL